MMGILTMVMETNHDFVFHEVCMDQEYGLVGHVAMALEVFLKIVDHVSSHLLIAYLSKHAFETYNMILHLEGFQELRHI
jgi:hypothetical protein